MKDGHLGIWAGEVWVTFHHAAFMIGDRLAIPHRAAQAHLRKLCASGEIRTIATTSDDIDETPEHVPPSQWRVVGAVDACWEVGVSESDLWGWLERQPTQPTGGKQSRIARLLAEMFPTGVPSRADYPREPLRAELLRRDPTLSPLDLKTLQRAIEARNRLVGNTRNASAS
jgi:hypothetical protein